MIRYTKEKRFLPPRSEPICGVIFTGVQFRKKPLGQHLMQPF